MTSNRTRWLAAGLACAVTATLTVALVHRQASAQAGRVQVPAGVHASDIARMSDSQTIVTPSGGRVRAGTFHRLQQAIGRSRHFGGAHARQGFALLPAVSGGTAPAPGETSAALLARPPSDIVRLPSGRSVSVAQLRAMSGYVAQRYGLDVEGKGPKRPSLSGPAVKIASLSQLKSLPKSTPDATILETPQGTRITYGELKTTLKAVYAPRAAIRPVMKAQP